MTKLISPQASGAISLLAHKILNRQKTRDPVSLSPVTVVAAIRRRRTVEWPVEFGNNDLPLRSAALPAKMVSKIIGNPISNGSARIIWFASETKTMPRGGVNLTRQREAVTRNWNGRSMASGHIDLHFTPPKRRARALCKCEKQRGFRRE
ncbi:unnamed protein product [Bursaphelenchus xylophilus]|uniref:(pine wood nematode) hypothetical protein n=1 Tax=Bursaphelenchus xylophilus TaxID=6326 RepID=A0A1I7RHL0_BURXY|nr:unnamed protein product [Bursaphelenchus xylophilus]CAG9115631.1 unnamed protein product [Bursaphelenchus xylophilus]